MQWTCCNDINKYNYNKNTLCLGSIVSLTSQTLWLERLNNKFTVWVRCPCGGWHSPCWGTPVSHGLCRSTPSYCSCHWATHVRAWSDAPIRTHIDHRNNMSTQLARDLTSTLKQRIRVGPCFNSQPLQIPCRMTGLHCLQAAKISQSFRSRCALEKFTKEMQTNWLLICWQTAAATTDYIVNTVLSVINRL